jgi:hypothetical protein
MVAHLDTKLYLYSSCNLLETINNKWLQQSDNCTSNLFAATCSDKIREVMKMTNYMA